MLVLARVDSNCSFNLNTIHLKMMEFLQVRFISELPKTAPHFCWAPQSRNFQGEGISPY